MSNYTKHPAVQLGPADWITADAEVINGDGSTRVVWYMGDPDDESTQALSAYLHHTKVDKLIETLTRARDEAAEAERREKT